LPVELGLLRQSDEIRIYSSMLSKKQKQNVIDKFKTHATDTGSPQVQIAILTAEVKDLTKHLRIHKKDFSSRRGLVKKVVERRRLLKYLEREDSKEYKKLVEVLKIRVSK
jgi:small subunit ribosomal protein S15